MQKERYFDFIIKYFPYISLIFVLDVSISLWWSYLTFEREIYEWILFKAVKNVFIVFILEIFIIHIFFLFFKERARYIVYFLAVYAVIAFILQTYLLVNYSAKFNPMFIDFFLQTNLGEIYEFFEFYIDIKLISIFILFLLFIFLWIYFFSKIQKYLYLPNKKILISFCAIYIFVIVGLLLDCANRYFIKKQGINSLDKINFTFFFDLPLQIRGYYGDTGLWANYVFYLNNYQNVANSYKEKINIEKRIPYVVFIVGESTQRNYMSLYGYDLKTTPNLDILEKNGNLIKFSDTISPFASTQASLRRIMNFSNIENEENWYDRLNIIDLFELAGYNTAFISNHEPMSGHTSITTAVANRAKETIFLNKFATDDKIFTKAFDTEMLPLIKDRINEKNFFVLQLMGTHFRYDRRYEKQFAKFTSKDIKRNLDEKFKVNIANYANAVLYNDYFVNEVFSFFKDKEAIIVYISDHGESVYEYRDRAEHFVTSRFTAEIPFFFIVSDKFKQNNPELVDRIIKAKNRPFMIDDLIHTMTTIGGIKVEDYDPARDVLSDEFNSNRIRIFNGEVDYDKVLKYEKARY
ncbi:phosphoethanolamine transferase [Campylobacter sp. RKI_CA19_01128]|uniref:phosphoethanolamine transferase n=1 Tax=unclassified Campylobacter TaxID=2593542 RepID=UPI0021E702F7|nr:MULTISPECIES: phosphoethanolamine transferase [unclassified Campylobacter]MCV3349238.1 phosphoethanolamine transferase [Campylobacter sp. RKI_CA19_01127]MCV3355150.1 phosphoethanolamine transferase [Campylobacter sp. RKI_CA19_01128]HEC1776703.1 phosphoethanolamine transferase [Campylobacter lari]HEC1777275.1 phosphoethanolamine transferase [Campylobacter lari]